jgi:hypothetical protein
MRIVSATFRVLTVCWIKGHCAGKRSLLPTEEERFDEGSHCNVRLVGYWEKMVMFSLSAIWLQDPGSEDVTESLRETRC